MTIIGFDPGIAIVGYGIIEAENSGLATVRYGVIRTDAGLSLSERLLEISRDVAELIERFRPERAAVEELFFNTNVKTAISVAHGRGVILAECMRAGLRISEFTPLQVKQSVVGYGRAEKKQVMEMTRIILGLNEVPKPDDAADALAVAVCCAHTLRY